MVLWKKFEKNRICFGSFACFCFALLYDGKYYGRDKNYRTTTRGKKERRFENERKIYIERVVRQREGEGDEGIEELKYRVRNREERK